MARAKSELSGTLVLSPHADDAALSVGGCLLSGVFRPPVTLATVFGRSNYASGGFQSDWREVTNLRKSEDLAYSSLIGLALRFLELPEAGLRDDVDHPGVWAEDVSEPFAAPPELAEVLGSLLEEFSPALLVAPLGIGCHRDHLLVQRAARKTGELAGHDVVYYEDLPYAERLTNRELSQHARAVDNRLEPWRVSISQVLDRKIQALDCYPSQLDPDQISATRRHATQAPNWWQRLFGRSPAFETLWKLP